jgi:hypothetical protein
LVSFESPGGRGPEARLAVEKSLPVPKKPTGPIDVEWLRQDRVGVPAPAVSQRTVGIA